MQIREASEKWNISERRIRQLIQDGRIEGAYIEYYVTGTSQKKSGFILYAY